MIIGRRWSAPQLVGVDTRRGLARIRRRNKTDGPPVERGVRALICVLSIAGAACEAQPPASSPPVAPPAVTPAAPPTSPSAAPPTTVAPPPSDWPPRCAQSIRQAVDELAARDLVFEYTDIVACPAELQPSSNPHYAKGGCADRAVDASFQAPNDPEHIYFTVEELQADAATAPPRGMRGWAAERAGKEWLVVDETDHRYLVRKNDQLIVLIRLLYKDHPTERAESFLTAMSAAADECLAFGVPSVGEDGDQADPVTP